MLTLGSVALFTLAVLAHPALTAASFLALARAYLGISVLLIGSALLCFAGVAFVRAGIASRWTAAPLPAIAAAFRARWAEDRMLTLAWPMAAFVMLLPAFNGFKQRILPQAGFVWDPQLAALDRGLFGTDPGVWLHAAIGSPATTAFFDAMYHSWFVPTTLGLCVVGLCAGRRTRSQYLLAYVGTWVVLGAVLAYLLPAAGPAFYGALVDPAGAAPFTAVQAQLEAANAGGTRFLTSIHNQQYLLQSLGSPTLVIGGGISAIPSVHNAMAVLFALASFRAHWLAGVAMSLFALLIWIASVYLNWHYAVDGIAGAIGAVGLWFGAGWLVDAVTRRSPAEAAFAPQPVPAA